MLLVAAAPAALADDSVLGRQSVWRDDLNQVFDVDGLRTRQVIVTLAYGACRRVCSTSLRLLERLQSIADERGVALDFVVVGLDPGEDRPEDWHAFRRQRGLVRDNWHFLTGDDAAVRGLAQRLSVRVWRYDSHLMHDFRIVSLSPGGRVLHTIDRFDQPLASLLP
jgi:cytochrome oxidase Cu insertion factor (SCO1/SenC/PrrC family)